MRRVAALIKERHVPVASSSLMKPSEVVVRLEEGLPFRVTMHTHIRAWQTYQMRSRSNSKGPQETDSRYCLYDDLSKSYGYREAWVEHLCGKLGDSHEYQRVRGVPAVLKDSNRPEEADSEFV